MIRPHPRARIVFLQGHHRVQPLLLLALLCASTAAAQNVTEPSLKAAFIYNFAKFTVWPPDVLSPSGTFTACVIGDSAVFAALERTVRDRQVSGHGISVLLAPFDGSLRPCHLLYVSGVAPAHVAVVLATLRGLAVLTISDIDDFTRQGGIVQMFVESGRIRFDINFAVAKQSRLQLSSKLLMLGAHIVDVPKAEVEPSTGPPIE